jgi:hypothetical protein
MNWNNKMNWNCFDCGKNTRNDKNYYMVTSYLWIKYGVGNRVLCPSCFSKRMGRKITKKDLTNCKVNEEFIASGGL